MNGPLHDPDVRRTWITLADAAQTVATPCREAARDLWHADHVDDRSVAAGLCAACPLLTPCGQYADRAEETHGVWGGRDFQTQRRTETTTTERTTR